VRGGGGGGGRKSEGTREKKFRRCGEMKTAATVVGLRVGMWGLGFNGSGFRAGEMCLGDLTVLDKTLTRTARLARLRA
jgi:hypothetical protein